MKKSLMRSRSEHLQGRVIKSQWTSTFKEESSSYKVNIRLREVIKTDGTLDVKTDYTILLVDTCSDEKLINTEFGLVCKNCKTSEYLQDQYIGEGWSKQYAGCTCTRCNSATLK